MGMTMQGSKNKCIEKQRMKEKNQEHPRKIKKTKNNQFKQR